MSEGLILSRIISKQLALQLPFRGGKRRGAGRKPKAGKALVSHAARPRFERITPAHVMLKARRDAPSLRSSRRFAAIRDAFVAARGLHGMRLIEFAVQGEHVHLIVEADNNQSLSRGMQGLCVRIARAVNRASGRIGTLFADHYHSRLLKSPTELVTAIRYVLTNAEHHFGDPGPDCCSSLAANAAPAVAAPQSWLFTLGWRLGRWPKGGPPRSSRYARE